MIEVQGSIAPQMIVLTLISVGHSISFGSSAGYDGKNAKQSQATGAYLRKNRRFVLHTLDEKRPYITTSRTKTRRNCRID